MRVRVGGDGVTGFDRLTAADWPHPNEVVVVRPRTTSVEVWRSPSDPGPKLRFDDRRTVYGKIALLAIDRRDGFWRVAIPVRPNGTTAWVRESDVEAHIVPERIVVELATNTLRLYRGSEVVLQTKVATGTGGTPTPKGLFFVKEVVPQKNPNGAYGPIALGLSAFSETLKRFAGGSAIIAIHGTNAPGSIGRNASHGCIRVPNDVIGRLASAIALGTPSRSSRPSATCRPSAAGSSTPPRPRTPPPTSPCPTLRPRRAIRCPTPSATPRGSPRSTPRRCPPPPRRRAPMAPRRSVGDRPCHGRRTGGTGRPARLSACGAASARRDGGPGQPHRRAVAGELDEPVPHQRPHDAADSRGVAQLLRELADRALGCVQGAQHGAAQLAVGAGIGRLPA